MSEPRRIGSRSIGRLVVHSDEKKEIRMKEEKTTEMVLSENILFLL
jgi:hypothetical protein